MAKNAELLEIIDLVGQAMEESRPYGLQIEVMASTIQRIQKDPKMDLATAISDALAEWDL